ncbi:hypothetical protein AB0M29_36805 [Streptomyces sp. NPDC051976]|uniref:hypothetical protein n=1 Tax=Streptomyces sp. NPDC051976 TaxID=3154947 RepID=UPI00343FF872
MPRWFDRRGGWQAPDAADPFARYTQAILPVLVGQVEWVCTINEPTASRTPPASPTRSCCPTMSTPCPTRRSPTPWSTPTARAARCFPPSPGPSPDGQ